MSSSPMPIGQKKRRAGAGCDTGGSSLMRRASTRCRYSTMPAQSTPRSSNPVAPPATITTRTSHGGVSEELIGSGVGERDGDGVNCASATTGIERSSRGS